MNNFYEYNQNNSGGSFHKDDKVCHRLFIQASDANEADEKAKSLGVYFDGCDAGLDCDCCGDRWYRAYSGLEFPMDWGSGLVFHNVEEYAQYLADEYGWTNPDARIYYEDGTVKEIERVRG